MSVDITKGATVELVKTLSDDLRTKDDNTKYSSAGAAMRDKANVDGYYESLTSGQTEQLVSTVGITDNEPYLFRTAGGSADIGDRAEVKKIVGGTIAWNQLLQNGNFAEESDWQFNNTGYGSYSVQNNIATIVVGPNTVGNTSSYFRGMNFANVVDHVYMAVIDVNPSVATSFRYQYPYAATGTRSKVLTANVWQTYGSVVKGVSNTSCAIFYINVNAALSENDTILVKNAMVFDLTQMFGSTIANYIYTLEQSTAGAGVAFFRSLFPAPYYAYDAGTLMHVQTSGHKMVGFNAWDGSAGEIVGSYRVIDVPTLLLGKCSMTLKDKDTSVALPSGCAIGFVREDWEPSQGMLTNQDYRWVYYQGNIRSNTSNTNGGTSASDGNKLLGRILIYPNTLAAFEAITSRFYLGVNLSWDGERDGEYEPYEEHTYPLDDVELRGIPKLDANNNLYYDGDEYASDGTVTRKYAQLTLNGTETWGLENDTGSQYYRFYTSLDSMKRLRNYTGEILNDKAYVTVAGYTSMYQDVGNYAITAYSLDEGTNRGHNWFYVFVKTTLGISDVAAFKTWLASNPLTIVYELATPTTESADPYQNPQIVNDWGTEEYVDSRTVPIPVGHDTMYRANLRAKLEMAPDSPSDGDGDYIVRQTNGENAYVKLVIPTELPTEPSEDGTYTLKCTVASGTATLSWESDE